MHRTAPRIARRALVVVLVGVVAALVAALCTGKVHYVSTHGVSMIPTYHDGELVVVARADRYHVGQIAAYRNPVDGVTVLHRIVGGDEHGWVFKGDNNGSIDIAHPTSAQLVGRAVAHVAGLGRWVSSPLIMGVGGGAAALCLVGSLTLFTRRRREPAVVEAQPSTASSRRATRPRRRPMVPWAKVLLIALDVVAVAALAVAVAFPVRHGAGPRPIQQQGTFRYEGVAPASDAYPSGVIRTGDAVFTRLATDVTVHFDYSTDAPPDAVHGTVELELELSNRTGWRTRRELVPAAPITDGVVALRAALDLRSIQALADRVAAESGINGAGIDIVVHAVARVAPAEPGTTAGDSTTDFSLALQLSPLEMTLDLTAAAGTVVTDTPSGPAVVAAHALDAPVASVPSAGLVTDGMRRVAFFFLLGVIAMTFALWPQAAPSSAPDDVPDRDPEGAGELDGPLDGDRARPAAPVASGAVTEELANVLHHERRRAPRTGISTGSFPDGIACDGLSVWVANSGCNTVSQIDPVTHTRIDHVTGEGPRGIALDGTNVWVANSDSNTISRIHPVTGVRTDFPAGDGPTGITHDGTHVWVTNSRGACVSRIDPVTGSRTEYASGPHPAGIAFDGWHLWVANFGSDTVSRIDPREVAPGAPVEYRVGANPMGVAFDGQNIWVANFGGDTVSCIDPRDAAPGRAVHHPVGSNPRGITWDGSHLWVTNFSSGTVSLIDPNGAEAGTAVTYATGSNPCGISSDGAAIWVTNFSANTVSVIRGRRSTPTGGTTGPVTRAADAGAR